jgi:predicted permease
LVVVQVALALVLLVSSGLMIRTFQALKHVPTGFVEPEDVQTLRIFIPESLVRDPVQVVRMEQDIMNKIGAVPGVLSVGMTSVVPMTGQGWHDPIWADDRVYADGKIPPIRTFKFVSPGLLETMGNRLIAGRDFTWTDVYDRRPVAMLSANLARDLWGDPGAAIGRRIRERLDGRWREVIGVVSDERDDGVKVKAPAMAVWPVLMDDFEGDRVFTQRGLAYMIRSSRTGSRGFLAEISQAVWSVNANLPLASVRSLKEIYDRSMARTSFTLVMLAIAGTMALLLGLAGIYGVISYSVSQRTREIGIRLALGARNEEVTRMFVGHGVCGLVVAVALMRVMSSLLFDVSPMDPLTYAVVSLGLVAAAVLASYLPALRATSVDPVVTLRAE